METSIIHIFETFAYPIAVSVVLFLTVYQFGKKILADIRSREESSSKLRDQYIAYLQMANVELTAAVKENATAFNRFSAVLERLENTINNGNKQIEIKKNNDKKKDDGK